MAVERWTDTMLDELASTVRETSSDVKELTSTVHEVSDSVDGLRITAQALLQIAAQSQQDMELIKQRQAESDQTFNVLLEEVRYLIRGNQEG
jgi:methyl-accepting chemotaxis protein